MWEGCLLLFSVTAPPTPQLFWPAKIQSSQCTRTETILPPARLPRSPPSYCSSSKLASHRYDMPIGRSKHTRILAELRGISFERQKQFACKTTLNVSDESRTDETDGMSCLHDSRTDRLHMACLTPWRRYSKVHILTPMQKPTPFIDHQHLPCDCSPAPTGWIAGYTMAHPWSPRTAADPGSAGKAHP